MIPIDEFKRRLSRALKQTLPEVFELAEKQLPEGSKKRESLLLLQARYADLQQKTVRGVISRDEASLETNRIREQLLLWIDSLKATDLQENGPGQIGRRPASLLIIGAALFLGAIFLTVRLMLPADPIEVSEKSTADSLSNAKVLDTSGQEEARDRLMQKSPQPPETVAGIKDEQHNSTAEKTNRRTFAINIQVLPLWMDSEIEVDGRRVEPLGRIGNILQLALPAGNHKIRLTAGEAVCEKNVNIQTEGQRFALNCE